MAWDCEKPMERYGEWFPVEHGLWERVPDILIWENESGWVLGAVVSSDCSVDAEAEAGRRGEVSVARLLTSIHSTWKATMRIPST